MIMPTPAPAQFRAELNRAIGYEKRALEYLRMAMAMDPFILDGSGRLRVLSETFGSRLDARELIYRGTTVLLPLNPPSAALGTAIYTRARGLRPLVTETLSYLAGERQALRGRLYMHEQQHSIALRQGAAAQERLRNVRRTLFVDTLRGQDSSMGDPFVNQDQVTLLKWLKEALEAGRLSVPTAADLSTAMKDADRDGMNAYLL